MKRLAGLYAIIDPSLTPGLDPVKLALDYLKGGLRILQLRNKKGIEREAAKSILALKKDYSFTFIINDDLKAARELGADGVHVGKDDASIEECRRLLGPARLVGYSSHSLEEAGEAQEKGADYVAFGAIYPTPSKGPGHPIQGIRRLQEVVDALDVPVVAIGGIGRDNIKDVLATGAAMVAMISALAKAGNRSEEARYFSGLFEAL